MLKRLACCETDWDLTETVLKVWALMLGYHHPVKENRHCQIEIRRAGCYLEHENLFIQLSCCINLNK